MPRVILNDKTYDEVKKVNLPSEGTARAVFYDSASPEPEKIYENVSYFTISPSDVGDKVENFIREALNQYSASTFTDSIVSDYIISGKQVYHIANTAKITLKKASNNLILDGYTFPRSGTTSEVQNLIPKRNSQTTGVVECDSSGNPLKIYMVNPIQGNQICVRAIKMKDVNRNDTKIIYPNVRDLGGWPCSNGTISYGKIFRGGMITDSGHIDLDNKDRNVLLNQLKIARELDLRHEDGQPVVDALGLGENYYKASGNIQYIISDLEEWKRSLMFVFSSVINDQPLYIHCAAGADRTGSICYVLERLLGVEPWMCDIDYELTSFYTERLRTNGVWTSFKKVIDSDETHGAYEFCTKTCGINHWFVDAFIAKMTGQAMPMPEFGEDPDPDPPDPKYEWKEYNYGINTDDINKSFSSNLDVTAISNRSGYFITQPIKIADAVNKIKIDGILPKESEKTYSYFAFMTYSDEDASNPIRAIKVYNGSISNTDFFSSTTEDSGDYKTVQIDNLVSFIKQNRDNCNSVRIAIPYSPDTAMTNVIDKIKERVQIYFYREKK